MHKVSFLFKAVSDPTRLRILGMLRAKPLCVSEISYILKLALSTVSKHLSILQSAGFIMDEKDGKWVIYRRNDDPRNERVQALYRLIDQWINDEEQAKKDYLAATVADRNAICGVPAHTSTNIWEENKCQ